MVKGISTEVGTLEWDTPDPLHLSNFESQARHRRYRHLAVSAHQRQIRHLFLGHHRDDLVETVLIRLTRSLDPSLLAVNGMVESSPIPCCEDIWGIRHELPPLPSSQLFGSEEQMQQITSQLLRMSPRKSFPIRVLRPGGTMLHRPFLSFPKDMLVATCDAHKIPYVMDATNYDPTLTRRNTIRSLKSVYKLPKAIQGDSILSLAQAGKAKVEDIRRRGSDVLKHISTLLIDINSGVLELAISKHVFTIFQNDRLAVANALQRLCDLVSPQSFEQGRLLASSAFVELFINLLSASSMDNKFPSRIGTGEVLMEKIYQDRRTNITHIWRLSRRKPARSKGEESDVSFEEDHEHSSKNGVVSKFMLWDYRYWIRLHASHSKLLSAVRVRFFLKEDTKMLREKLKRMERVALDDLLTLHAKGDIRFSLPVLTVGGQIVALPTLQAGVVSRSSFNKEASLLGLEDTWLKWEVCYKVIK
jgi:tRNA(Ile)-lysidine synthase